MSFSTSYSSPSYLDRFVVGGGSEGQRRARELLRSNSIRYPKKKPEAKIMPNSFKQGDWVRVIRNDHNCHSPNREGQMVEPYEGLRVHKFDVKPSNDGRSQPMVFYLVNRSNCYIPAKDVELIEDCICAKPVLKIGCKCGHLTMIKWKEKDAIRRVQQAAANEPQVLVPPGPNDND